MRIAVNGVFLNVEEKGSGRPLLLLHGFTGDASTWRSLMESKTLRRRALAVDLLGHGRSDAPVEAERYTMAACVQDLLALLEALGVGEFDVLGYSMGGRVALQLAAAAPARIGALILESSTPGIADPAERRARRAQDEALAVFVEAEGIEAFVDRWERLPLFASQRQLPAHVRAELRRQRLANSVKGLAGSLRGMGTGAMKPLWEALPRLTMPVLLITGALDEKFCAISERMAARLPDATRIVVPGAGHNVHLERPAVFQQAVETFLHERVKVG